MKRANFLLAAILLMSCGDLRAASTTVLRKAPEARIEAIRANALVLKGSGTFRYMGVKLYEASFYSPQGNIPEDELLSRSPKKLTIRYAREIPRDAILEAAEKNLRGNPDVDYAAIRERLEKFNSKYVTIRPGDRYELLFADGKTSLYYNGKKEIEVLGEDFGRAYFGIWLSRYPINQKLKLKLLGERS